MSGACRAIAIPPRIDAEELNGAWEEASPEEILRCSVATFPADRLALVSAFGPGTLVLIHMLADIAPQVPVIFVDTLYHFQETLDLVERLRLRYHLNLRVYRPAPNREEFEARHGSRLWERDIDRYHHLTKVEPFRQATASLDAWATGRRRDQSPERAQMPVVEGGDKIRINPLATWTRTDVWRYILDHEIPYNPLHDLGYASIGDEPLTTGVAPGEHERAGRWRGLGITECGIHLP